MPRKTAMSRMLKSVAVLPAMITLGTLPRGMPEALDPAEEQRGRKRRRSLDVRRVALDHADRHLQSGTGHRRGHVLGVQRGHLPPPDGLAEVRDQVGDGGGAERRLVHEGGGASGIWAG